MARTAMVIKSQRPPRYRVQQHNRCRVCGRSRGFIRKFGMCRICFRRLALVGQVPGVRKSSW